MKKKYDIYLVEWIDAVSADKWDDLTSHIDVEPHVIVSVGFLLAQNKKKTILCLNIDEAGESASCAMTIPTVMILSKTKINKD